jgi:hypothetical protein
MPTLQEASPPIIFKDSMGSCRLTLRPASRLDDAPPLLGRMASGRGCTFFRVDRTVITIFSAGNRTPFARLVFFWVFLASTIRIKTSSPSPLLTKFSDDASRRNHRSNLHETKVTKRGAAVGHLGRTSHLIPRKISVVCMNLQKSCLRDCSGGFAVGSAVIFLK